MAKRPCRRHLNDDEGGCHVDEVQFPTIFCSKAAHSVSAHRFSERVNLTGLDAEVNDDDATPSQ
jgi:hypothetical protein